MMLSSLRFPLLFSLILARIGWAQVAPGVSVANGTELRILPIGDSITWGFQSPDGNGYRLELLNDLSADPVVFAGVIQNGNMTDNWMAGYPGQTIDYIAGQANQSLVQQPNIVLLHAGTNDMNPDPSISVQGVAGAADRLGALIDQIVANCPDAVVLVAQIINAADPTQESNTMAYDDQIPGVVQARADKGDKVMTVDFRSITADMLIDGVHPTEQGYQAMGDIWYQALHNITQGWITTPIGPDPDRS